MVVWLVLSLVLRLLAHLLCSRVSLWLCTTIVLVGWSVGWLVGWLVGWSMGQSYAKVRWLRELRARRTRAAVFEAWVGVTVESRRIKEIGRKVRCSSLVALVVAGLFCFGVVPTWRSTSGERANLTLLVRVCVCVCAFPQIMHRLLNQTMAKMFQSWKEAYLQGKHEKAVMAQFAARWRNRTIWGLFLRWKQHAQRKKAARLTADAMFEKQLRLCLVRPLWRLSGLLLPSLPRCCQSCVLTSRCDCILTVSRFGTSRRGRTTCLAPSWRTNRRNSIDRWRHK